MSTSSQQSGSESSPMDVVAMEQQAAQDRIEDDVNDLVARIANTMGPVPARQEQLADAQQSQALPARTSRRERWQTQAPEVNLQRTVASILSAVFQRVDDRNKAREIEQLKATLNEREKTIESLKSLNNRLQDDVNDLVARIANTMGPVPARQEQLADAQQSQALPARTSRRERWQTQAPEANLQRTVASILSAVFQRVDDRRKVSLL
ncbi:hypothetical protein Y032_0068g182 [Ancylostoma ceylanicum]|uniref:Uncharacterized protein n=3 Tax=Ancylostoma ceylanicum TaxID=53326 RepID=A0A016TZ39_9BILA|nr:hypothetical protein Y032_0068g182 [Ancylostoma ceylanicum]